MRIGVLCGGLSEERDVSLRTGEAIYQGLLSKGYEVTKYDVDRNFLYNLKKDEFDLAFIALHGKYGEDGTIQGYLELLDIPYTGPGVLASSIAMNKIMTKKLLSFEGIPTAKFTTIKKADITEENMEAHIAQILSKIPLPLVVKAPTQGSSIGVYFVDNKEELAPAIKLALQYDEEILIEEMLNGKELTVSILGNHKPIALPAIEIVSNTGVYDYESKYTVGLSEHIIPAGITSEQEELIKQYALAAYQAVGCRGLSRVDFMLTDSGKPMVLEINTIPGMTNTSLFPDAAKAAGIDFPELVERLVKLALEK